MKLKHKRLLSLWDTQTYGKKAHKGYKPIDGLFIFQSLFSVGAFATKKDDSASTLFAKRITEKLLLKVKKQRNDILALSQTLLTECGDIDLNQFTPQVIETIEVDKNKLTPESTMLIKVFVVCDEYFTHLYKARKNGELTEKEHQGQRATLIRNMNMFLNDIHKTCSTYHQVRKKFHEEVL